MSEPLPEAKQAAECPFCGGLGVLLSTGDIPRYAEVWVQCNECGAQGPRFPHYDRDKLGSDKAWAVWRKRADTATAKLREELLHMTQSRDQWKKAYMELEGVELAHQQPSTPTADVEKIAREKVAAREIGEHYIMLFDEIRRALGDLIPTDASKKEIIDKVKELAQARAPRIRAALTGTGEKG